GGVAVLPGHPYRHGMPLAAQRGNGLADGILASGLAVEDQPQAGGTQVGSRHARTTWGNVRTLATRRRRRREAGPGPVEAAGSGARRATRYGDAGRSAARGRDR